MQVGKLSAELEEARAIAEDRLKETQELSQQLVQLRVDLELTEERKRENSVVSSDVTTSAAYLTLQTQFSIVQQGMRCWSLQQQYCVPQQRTTSYSRM